LEPELPEDVRPGLVPLDEEVDHARGPTAGRLILEYGDYECPYSRQAFRAIEYMEQELSGRVRFAFRHFPLVQIHPHAFGAAAAAEAAALQGCFWAMHELLFQSQKRSKTTTFSGTPNSSTWTSHVSTRIAWGQTSDGGSAAMSRPD
jgi:hypothetical protein